MLYPERGLDSLTQVVSGEVLRGRGGGSSTLVVSGESWNPRRLGRGGVFKH